MPPTTEEQRQRRDAIRDLLAHGPAETQASLVGALEGLGFVATQSSVSRDLRELGAIKTTRGYELPGAADPGDEQIAAVGNLLRSITPAGSTCWSFGPVSARPSASASRSTAAAGPA